jgi:glutathione synthase/RimK-type ligase-like ATP-grasp enzyme
VNRTIFCTAADEWAFGAIAQRLSALCDCPVVSEPQGLCYLLSDPQEATGYQAFIPLSAVHIAADKREIEQAFARGGIARPRTWILLGTQDVEVLLHEQPERRFILKYPTSCGGSGHYVVQGGFTAKRNWPTPFIVQEFVTMAVPRVYRAYFAGGVYLGSNVRRFPQGICHDLVAHARGARYFYDDPIPDHAVQLAAAALRAVGLLESFGVVDLLQSDAGEWLTLEVGTDGIYNHVDRDIDNEAFLDHIYRGIAAAFLSCASHAVG